MSPDQVRHAIFDGLISSWGTCGIPIALPNRTWTPTITTSWIQPTITYGPTVGLEVGTEGLGMRIGLLEIVINTPLNVGSKIGLDLANRLEGIFRRADFGKIFFDEPVTRETGVSGDSYCLQTTVPFYAYVGETD
jgi:hypothetical protein